jgi:hypothetical protein
MKVSLCHSGVVLMKMEYTNQEHNRSMAMQHTATSTMTTTEKPKRYFKTPYGRNCWLELPTIKPFK